MSNNKPLDILPAFFYDQWYDKIKGDISREDKEKVLKRISELSLERPLHIIGVKVDLKEVPELAKYSNVGHFSGIQLLTVMKAMFKEIHGELD